MADNPTPETAAIDTDTIRAVVQQELSRHDFVTSAQVTALLEKQTDTFQAGLGSLRVEVLDGIKNLRGEVFTELKDWRKIIKAQDLTLREAEAQTRRYAELAAEVKGQNTAIADSLTRFSNRLDRIMEEVDENLSDMLDKIEAKIAGYTVSVQGEINELKTSVHKNTTFRERREKIEQTISKYAGILVKNTGFRWAVGVGATALLSYLGYSAATNSNIVYEFIRILGGG